MRLCEFPGGNRQAERWKSQGVPLAERLCEFPGLAPQAGFGTAVPTYPPSRSDQKSRQGAKRTLTAEPCPPEQKMQAGLPTIVGSPFLCGWRGGLLCKSFCTTPASGAKHRDLQHFVGDATGIMPVRRKTASSGVGTAGIVAFGSSPACIFYRFAIGKRWGMSVRETE